MIIYKSDLIVKPIPDGETWELVEDFEVTINTHTVIIVPKGFNTDFASIPKIFWTMIGSPARGKYRKGAVIHDYLYALGIVPRKTCDDILYECMISDGVPLLKAYLIYSAVRIGGYWSYKHNG